MCGNKFFAILVVLKIIRKDPSRLRTDNIFAMNKSSFLTFLLLLFAATALAQQASPQFHPSPSEGSLLRWAHVSPSGSQMEGKIMHVDEGGVRGKSGKPGNQLVYTPWVTGISAVLGIAVFLLIQNRFQSKDQDLKRQQHALEAEKQRLRWREEDLRYTAAHQQVNHHSLFFNLGSIQSALEARGETELAARLAPCLGHIRKVIHICRQEEISLAQELQLAQSLIASESTEVEFELRNESGEDLANLAFPTLALLPLVENALRHGNLPAGQSPRLEVQISSGPDTLSISLHNPIFAPGSRNHNARPSIGIQNCRERLSLWAQRYGSSSRLDLDLQADRAIVTLTLPILRFDAA